MVTPFALPFAALRLDLLVMLAFAALTFVFLLTQRRLERWGGRRARVGVRALCGVAVLGLRAQSSISKSVSVTPNCYP